MIIDRKTSQNTNIFKLNKNKNFPYSSSFDPVSSPSNHLLKNHFFTSFFISDSTFDRFAKMDHFDISFAIWGYLESSPDPGCQFPASISPNNTGEMSKIILFNECDKSEWRSLITKHEYFQIE